MPILTIQTAAPPPGPSSTTTGVRVFVSYAHDDARLAEKFIKYLYLLWSELGFDRASIFYDAARLRASYTWEPILLDALRSADLLIFLVSENSLSHDGYCMRTELAEAARAGIAIAPVVLTDCPWQGQRIPGDRTGRTLGAVGALPVSPESHVKPVTAWGKRDQAWNAVIRGLRGLLKPHAPATLQTGGAASPAAGVAVGTELLPYLCDQEPVILSFDGCLRNWDARALVVLVKGVYEDNPSRFWDRLRVEHLSRWVARDPLRGSSLVGSEKPLVLPVKGAAASSPDDVERSILYGLSALLTGDRYEIADAAALTARLEPRQGVIALLAIPAVDSEAALRAALEGLLRLIGKIGNGAVLRRMVIAVNLEDPRLMERELVAEWGLDRFASSYTVEVGPLAPVTWNDARVWHAEHQVEERTGVGEEQVRRLFSEGEALRLRQFETRLQPLLGGR